MCTMRDMKQAQLCKKLVGRDNCQLSNNLMKFYHFKNLHIFRKPKSKFFEDANTKKERKRKKYCSVLISHHLSKQRLLEYYLLKKPSVADNPGLS